MASDSKAEQIIQYWVDKFKAGDNIRTGYYKSVKRTRMRLADLRNYSGPSLPLLAIVNSLPSPSPHQAGRRAGNKDAFISDLRVEFICYGMDNENPSATILDLADDLWVVLYGDQTSGSGGEALTIGSTITPEELTYIVEPYYSFKMVCVFQYYHTTGGI